MTFPLDVTTELLLDGTWVDVSGDVHQRDPLTIKRGRSDESAQVTPTTCDLTLDNTSGNYSPRNPTGAHFGTLGRNTPIRVSTPGAAEHYLSLPGDESSASTPDAVSLGITGDIDIRIEVEPQSWRPAADSVLAHRVAEDGTTSWLFYLAADGTLILLWSEDGTFLAGASISTVAVPSTSTRLAVRVTLDVDNGAAGNDARFYTAPAIDGAWTQLGATVPGEFVPATSIFDNNAPVVVGATTGSLYAGPLQTKAYAFELRNGIDGTLVTSPDFTAAESGTTPFVDAQGLTWAPNGSAVVINPNARFHGEVSTWPQRWDPSGADVYAPIEAAGVMRRLGQGASPLDSVFRRALANAPLVVAYWPCEDGEDATELASGLPGHPAMSGTANFASFSGFKASAALPTFSGAPWVGKVLSHGATVGAQVRFLLAVPDSGIASATLPLCQVFGTGGAYRWLLDVDAAGSLRLRAYNLDGVLLGNSGFIGFAVNGKLLRVSLELKEGAGATVDWTLAVLEVGEEVGQVNAATFTDATRGMLTNVTINPGALTDDVAVGHVSVQNETTSIFDLHEELKAYAGETAADRILRLCRQQGVPCTITGDGAGTALVGPQLPRTLLELLAEAAAADLGILYEPRGFLGLAYRTRESLYAQDAAAELDYATADMSEIEPVEDDQGTRNDVTAQRTGGASARAELTEGPMSVNSPPDGVGRYDEAVTINLAFDGQLQEQATWRLHLGTVDEARYPVLGLNLARSAFTDEVGNFLSANAASLETSVADWSAGGSVPPTLTRSSTHAHVGAWALRIAWGAGGVLPLAQTTVTGLVIGRTYTASAYAWVPSGDVGVLMAISGISTGPAMTTKGAFARFSHTWVATATSHAIQVWPDASPAAGDLAWVDAVQVWEGSEPVEFTTTLAADTLSATVEELDIGDKVVVTNPPAWLPPDDINQIVQGLTEELGRFEWLVDVNCSPASPWDVGVYDAEEGPGEARYSSNGTVLDEDLDATETTVSVITDSGPVWSDADAPFDIYVGGERMTVTGVTFTTPQQNFTVTRSVNGVVKTHSTGVEVRLFKPAVYAL